MRSGSSCGLAGIQTLVCWTSISNLSQSVIVVIQSPSCVWLFVTPMDCSTPNLPVFHYLLEFAQVHVHCISDAIQPSHPLMPSSPSALNLSQHQGLFSEPSDAHRWLEFQIQTTGASFSISPSSEYSGFISLKIDWFDIVAVQGTFRSLLWHPSSKASICWCSAFFIVQLSQPYVTTGKTIALTIWTFVGRVMFSAFQHIV